MRATAACRACDAPIFWAITSGGKFMPVDAEAVEAGNVWIDHYERGQPVVHVAANRAAVPNHIALTYHAHWVTCPNPPPRHAHEARPMMR